MTPTFSLRELHIIIRSHRGCRPNVYCMLRLSSTDGCVG